MALIRAKQIRAKVKILDDIIKEYKIINPQKRRDYAKYEIDFKRRLKGAIRNLDKFISESINNLDYFSKNENKHSLPLPKRMRLILVKELNEKGNRKIANLLDLFSMMDGINVSYKTVERLYSDDKVILGLHNLFILILNKRGIKNINACGDATGYSLIISKHYSSYVQKLKDKAKESKNTKKAFVYKFALMDLETKMYVCYGSSLKSEKEAFDKAMQMLSKIDVKINSIRLDRYYSFPCYVNQFKNSKVFIIPRKNVELSNGFKWHETLKEFLLNTMEYLREYFQRNNSEAGWASDKKMFGWKISQKREDRIDTALFCRDIWHNLLRL
ncbi:ISNCY family transposase [Candidatus Pacearchaeota archaeon]|nr:ISNCY family transposase [Candidatus Pacearchaeota archaeon]